MVKEPLQAVGQAIRDARNLRGLSIKKLATITKVSRRHIAATEAGGNVTVLLLRRLMHALQVTAISLDERTQITASARDVDPGVLLTVADDLNEAAERILRSCAVLRTYAEGRQPADDDDDLLARGTALIRRFSEQVRRSDTPEKIEDLERLVGVGANTRQPARKRKRSA